jgi:tetratricopeptide (TPR) repeat protein
MNDKDAPDPGRARTLDEFVVQLRALKVWAGNPSISEITRRIHQGWRAAGRPAGELPARATVGYCMRTGRSRPNPDLLLAVVAALVGGDPATVHTWRQALRVVMGEADATGYVTATDRLPDDVAGFTGRVDILDRAAAALADGSVCVVEGMAGIGKTALAVRLAHRLLADSAAERVLFVNLRGFDSQHRPADPAAVLESFLRLLGIAGERIPHSLERRAAAFRRALAGTGTLVVLDNASGTAQVAPLLPGLPSCPVLVTSRTSLRSLPEACRVPLPVLRPDESMALLGQAAGTARIDADPHTAGRIADLLGHLPLALTVIGAHVREHLDWPLTDYPLALTALAMEGGVRAALTLSDRGLTPPARRLLRLLALHPGPDIDLFAAAALAGQDAGTTEEQLTALTVASLLTQEVPGRHTFHDLTHAYALERAHLDHSATHTRQALTRLFDYYTDATEAACHRSDGASEAEHWLDAELPNLLATAAHGHPRHTLHLSVALRRHLRGRARHDQARSLHEHALTVACATANPAAELDALVGLGHVHYLQGRHEQATDCYERALRIARATSDRTGQREAIYGLGHVHGIQGRHEQAVDCLQQALDIARAIDDGIGQHDALAGLGHISYLQGMYQRADDCFEEALRVARATSNRRGEQNALYGLGFVNWALGDQGKAAERFEQVLRLARTTGDPAGNPTGEIYALRGLGFVHWAQGRAEQAGECYRRALHIARASGNHHGELYALAGLGNVQCMRGHHQQAIGHYRHALRIGVETGDRNGQVEANLGLAHCQHSRDRHHDAITAYRAALDLASGLGQPRDAARAHDGLAHVNRALGDHDQANHHWRAALTLLATRGTEHTEDPRVSVATIHAHLTAKACPANCVMNSLPSAGTFAVSKTG